MRFAVRSEGTRRKDARGLGSASVRCLSMSTPRRVAIVGSALAGGAAQIIDALDGSSELVAVAIYDSDARAAGRSVLGIPVRGSSSDVAAAFRREELDCAVVGIGTLTIREAVFAQLLADGVPTCNVIDRSATVSRFAALGTGNVVLATSYLGPEVVLGDNCYLVTGTRINHHTRVGSHCYFASGVTISGRVTIGSRVRFDLASVAATDAAVPDGTVVPAGTIFSHKAR
jgi:UDP-perosamine 4-acetyltransferase